MTPSTALILYALFALGGLGLYFCMPRLDRFLGEGGSRRPVPTTAAGAIIGVAALAGLIALFAARFVGPIGERGYFYFFAIIAVLAAARVITHPKPVYSAIYVVALIVAVAALLVLQGAEFLAVALIIIYAGAILVTYLFVIMLAQQPGEQVYDRQAREPLAAMVVGFLLMGAIAGQTAGLTPFAPGAGASTIVVANLAPDEPATGNTFALGSLVMTKYVVVLQITGILLLISMIGAIALSKKRVPNEASRTPHTVLGQIGKEVEPF